MADQEKQHWVFRAHVVDRAGALTSIASAFSNEGISIDTIVGHGFEKGASVDGSVVLTCFCTEAEMDVMVRKVKRLSKVIDLKQHAYASQKLRKSAIVLTTRKLLPRDVAGETTFLTSELVYESPERFTFFLAGSPSELDAVLLRLEQDGIIKDIVYSIIGL